MTSHYSNKTITWSKNNKWKEENEEKKGYFLVIDNFFFRFNRENKSTVNYLCSFRKKSNCSGSCSIDKATRSKITYFVDHDVAHAAGDVEVNEFKQNLKKQAESNRTPLEQQFEVNFVFWLILLVNSIKNLIF